jgi:hypothetical protein
MTESPLLIVGVDRSGTTLLSLMLDSHSELAIPYESKFFTRYFRERARFGDLEDIQARTALVRSMLNEPTVSQWEVVPSLAQIDLTRCATLGGAIDALFSAYAGARGKRFWGDKTPAYITQIHVLNRLFPNAKYIHIVRDGRDVAISLMQQWWGPNDFASALHYWTTRVDAARKMLAMLPSGRVLQVRFEDLVADPKATLREISTFLELEFEENMVAQYVNRAENKVGKQRMHGIHARLSEPPSKDQAFKWRRHLSAADQALAYEIAGALFEELGYPPGVKRHPLKLLREAYHRAHGALSWRRSKSRNP